MTAHHSDPEMLYALRAMARLRRGEGTLVPWASIRDRRPRDRREALGGIAHGVLCRREWCQADGGSSSTAYEEGHRDWVDDIGRVVAELEHLDVGVRTPEFHALLLNPGFSDDDVELSDDEVGMRLGVAVHRAWCDRPKLLRGACGDPDNDAACPASFEVATRLIGQLPLTGLELIDLTRAQLRPRHG